MPRAREHAAALSTGEGEGRRSRGTIYQQARRQGQSSSADVRSFSFFLSLSSFRARLGHGTLELNPAASSGYRTFAPCDSCTHCIPRESLPLTLTVRPDNDPDEISFALKERGVRERKRDLLRRERLRTNEITPLCCRRQTPEFKRENEFLIRHGRSSDTMKYWIYAYETLSTSN